MEERTTILSERASSLPKQKLLNSTVSQQHVHVSIPIIRRKRTQSAHYDGQFNLHDVFFSRTLSVDSKENRNIENKVIFHKPADLNRNGESPILVGQNLHRENEESPILVGQNLHHENEESPILVGQNLHHENEESPILVGQNLHHENGTKSDSAKQGDCDDNFTEKTKLNLSKLPRRKIYILILCSFTYFMEGCGFSLLAPFFPQEAARKGMSPTLTGFVFSVFELVIFITSPIFGSCLTHLGPKFVVLAGIFVAGMCTVLFGTLDLCPSGTPFVVISILCRSVEAVGFSSYVTALMAIVISEFPKDVTTTFAVLETANGVGLMVGPAIGGALYEVGGFGLPFYVTGTCILVNGLFVFFVIPKPQNTVPEKALPVSKLSILRNPLVIMATISICVGCLAESFLDPTLANHLNRFKLSVAVIGVFFVLSPFVYTIFSPLWGFLTDRKGFYRQLIVIGHFLYGVGFLLIGPSELLPFLPFELWTVISGLVLQGAFFGCCLIPTMKCMLIGAMEAGFEENIETFAVVSGLLHSVYSFGAFLGPLVGGALVEKAGSSTAFTVVGLSNVGMSLVSLVFFLSRKTRCMYGQEKSEYQSLA